MKKRILSIICITVAALLMLASFSGCGKKGDSDIKLPKGMALARSEIAGCYFFYPETVWILGENGGYINIVKASRTNDNSSVTVNSWEEKTNISAAEYWNGIEAEKVEGFSDKVSEDFGGYEKTLTGLVQDYKAIEKKERKVNGHDGYSVLYTCNIAGKDFKILQITVAVKKTSATELFEITYTSTPELYDENIDAVNTMIESFVVE